MPVPEPEYSIVERNLRAAMRFFGEASGVGDITEREGLLLIDSGVNYSVFNIAMLTEPAVSPNGLLQRIRGAADYFEARNTRWSMWVCEDMLSEAARRRAPALFAGEQLRKLTEAPGMIAVPLLAPARALPAIEWRCVREAPERVAFGHVTSVTFDIPFAICQRVYGSAAAWAHAYHGYVAYANGAAVATAAVVVAAEAIGIYSVSTLPQHRRKGYAEALMRQVIAKYSKESGIRRVVLQATRAGYEMYLKLGFRPCSRFTVYMR